LRRRLPPLNAMRAFESAGRCGSFVQAAEELCVTPAAISQQIRILEEFLGVPLFFRVPGGTQLTPAGAEWLPQLTRSLDLIAESLACVQPEGGVARLTITAGPAFATHWLVPRLQEFRARQPAVDVRIVADLGLADLERDGVDVAIRFGHVAAGKGLHVEALIEESVRPMCSPAVAAALAADPLDLRSAALIDDCSLRLVDATAPDWARWAQWAGAPLGGKALPSLSFNQADHALQAAMGGAGVMLGRRVLATPAIQSGRLLTLWERDLPTGLWFYFVCRSKALQRPEIQSFRSWVIEVLGEVER
jgi:LysR family transcriptional regulator, glycine cleavage system transcriptional activator